MASAIEKADDERTVTGTGGEAGQVKELRLGLVCYGGVSLAIYMHGITKEMQKLVVASRSLDRQQTDGFDGDDTAGVYRDLLARIRDAEKMRTRVVVDVISGTSAGGINGIFLAKALAHNRSQDALTTMWFERGDIARLLGAGPPPEGTGWIASLRKRWHESQVRRKGLGKLWRLITQGKAPLEGDRMLRWLLDALAEMDRTEPPLAGEATLRPPEHEIALFVTTTDFYGYRRTIPISSPPSVNEARHRNIFRFRYQASAGGRDDFRREDGPALALAARSTSSFPGAFPPVELADLRSAGVTTQAVDHLKQSLFAPYRAAGRDPERTAFVDGGVLDNYPFKPTIETIVRKPAAVEVDRRLLYIQPDPGAEPKPAPGGKPGVVEAAWGGLSGLTSFEPILDDILAVRRFNDRVAMVDDIVEQCRGDMEQRVQQMMAAGKLPGADPSHEELEQLRDEMHDQARKEAGLIYKSYFQLKVEAVVDQFGVDAAKICGYPQESNRADFVRQVVRAWARAKNYIGHGADEQQQRSFLRRFDIGYTRRRVRFVRNGLNALYKECAEGRPSRADLDTAKGYLAGVEAGLAAIVDQGEIDRTTAAEIRSLFDDVDLDLASRQLERSAAQFAQDGAAGIDTIADQLGAFLQRERRELRRGLYREFNRQTAQWEPSRRLRVLSRYLCFPFWDALIYPYIRLSEVGELDPIEVVRMSPDDATLLGWGGPSDKLKGVGFAHFAAFFKRSYRENDYLWGRLDAAERLIAMLANRADGSELLSSDERDGFVKRAFAAILADEGPRLASLQAEDWNPLPEIERRVKDLG